MTSPMDQLAKYLDQTLGLALAPVPWAGGERLPLFLRDGYDFWEADFAGQRCLLVVDRDEREEPPATIRKHIDQVRIRWDGPVIYVRQGVTAYNRKRLIAQGVAFIVPGNQMYLPSLGIDLREHFRRPKEDRHRLRPSAQAVLIHMLLDDDVELGSADLVPRLGYSAMTISRAFDELDAIEIVHSHKDGRERRVRLAEDKPAAWQRAQPYLRDPAQSRHWVRIGMAGELPGPRAGLTALSHYSTLAGPENPVIAVSGDDWRSLQQRDALMEAIAAEADAVQVEVWSYSPTLFASNGLVDPLSLYLSLHQTEDERVEAALDEMMGDVRW